MATHSQYSCLETSMDRGVWWPIVLSYTDRQKGKKNLLIPLEINLRNVFLYFGVFRSRYCPVHILGVYTLCIYVYSMYIVHHMYICVQLWSMGFSRQEYWNGLPFPSPGDLPKPGIDPGSPAL